VQFIKLVHSKPVLINEQLGVEGTRHFRLAKFPNIDQALSTEQLIKRLEETNRQKQMNEETARTAEQTKTEAIVSRNRHYLINDSSIARLR
jgi:hypothetical protein